MIQESIIRYFKDVAFKQRLFKQYILKQLHQGIQTTTITTVSGFSSHCCHSHCQPPSPQFMSSFFFLFVCETNENTTTHKDLQMEMQIWLLLITSDWVYIYINTYFRLHSFVVWSENTYSYGSKMDASHISLWLMSKKCIVIREKCI